MKKILVFIIILFLVFSVYASTFTEKISRPITLQGAYGKVIEISFDRIATQSSSFTVGMPFDIEGRLVRYNKTSQGREISYWSVICNSKFKFEITATKLTSESPIDPTASTFKYTELDYIMTFTYSLGYTDSISNTQGVKAGTFSFNTETGHCTYTDPNDLLQDVWHANTASDPFQYDIIPANASDGALIGSVNGSVYFMFTQNATDAILADTPVTGNYFATVTMTITTTGE